MAVSPEFISEMFRYKTEYIINNLEEVITNDFKTFTGGLGIAQFEGFDLEYIINNKIQDIKSVLKMLKEEHKLQHIFLSAPDIKNSYNTFVTVDEETKLLLESTLSLSFNEEGVAKNDKLFLRKQILPLLLSKL